MGQEKREKSVYFKNVFPVARKISIYQKSGKSKKKIFAENRLC